MQTAQVAESLASRLRFHARSFGDYAVELVGQQATIWRGRAVADRYATQGWSLDWQPEATCRWNGYALVDVVLAAGVVELTDDVIAAAEDCIADALEAVPAPCDMIDTARVPVMSDADISAEYAAQWAVAS